jgi:hypothetical protein
MGCVGQREKTQETPVDTPISPKFVKQQTLVVRRTVKKDYEIVISDDKQATLDSIVSNWSKVDEVSTRQRVRQMCNKSYSSEEDFVTKGH